VFVAYFLEVFNVFQGHRHLHTIAREGSQCSALSAMASLSGHAALCQSIWLTHGILNTDITHGKHIAPIQGEKNKKHRHPAGARVKNLH